MNAPFGNFTFYGDVMLKYLRNRLHLIAFIRCISLFPIQFFCICFKPHRNLNNTSLSSQLPACVSSRASSSSLFSTFVYLIRVNRRSLLLPRTEHNRCNRSVLTLHFSSLLLTNSQRWPTSKKRRRGRKDDEEEEEEEEEAKAVSEHALPFGSLIPSEADSSNLLLAALHKLIPPRLSSSHVAKLPLSFTRKAATLIQPHLIPRIGRH